MALCHPARKAKCRGMCQPCYLRWLKATPPEERPRAMAGGRGAYSGPASCHPERPRRARGLCQPCYLLIYRQENIVRLTANAAEKRLKEQYGLTSADRDAMTVAQGGVCALCFKAPHPGRRLHVDHDHTTGRIRGLLCPNCNWYLAKIERDAGLIARIRSYLRID